MSTLKEREFERILEIQRQTTARNLYLKHGPTYVRKLGKAITGHEYELLQTDLITGHEETVLVKINDTKIRSLSDELYEGVDGAGQTYPITEEQYINFLPEQTS